MKQFYIGLILSLFFAIPTPILATEDIPTRHVLATDQVIDGDYFAAGEIVEILGTIKGDLYVVGADILISGTVEGDVLAAGGQVQFAGTSSNLRLLAGQAEIDGTILRNLSVAAGNITFIDPAIAGNVVIAGGNVTARGIIDGDVTAAVGNLNLFASVGQTVKAMVGQLRISENTDIGGNLYYWSESEAIIPSRDTINGELQQFDLPAYLSEHETDKNMDWEKDLQPFLNTGHIVFLVIRLTSLLILGLLLIHLMPNFAYRVITQMEDAPMKTLLVGITMVIITPVLGIILLILTLTFPLALFGFTLYGVLLHLAGLASSYWLGARILAFVKRQSSRQLTFIIGLLTLIALKQIWLFGAIVTFTSLIFGAGGIILALLHTHASARKLRIL